MVAQRQHDRSLRAEFVRFLPELKRVLRAKFRHLEAEARSESVSEAIAFAFGLWLSAKRRGKDAGVYSIGSFAALLVKSGRKFAGERKTDAFSESGRVTGKVPPIVFFEHTGRMHDLLLEDRRYSWAGPDRASFKIDRAEYLDRQPKRTRQIIEMCFAPNATKYQRAAHKPTVSGCGLTAEAPPILVSVFHAQRHGRRCDAQSGRGFLA